jgi:hypothetical protein
MNNPQVVQWARGLAGTLDASNPNTAIRELYLRTLTREPTATELTDSRAFFDSQSDSYSKDKNAGQLALADLCQVMFSLNEFIYLP